MRAARPLPIQGDQAAGIAPTKVADFTFKIYKPATFRKLRKQFGISEAAFRNSLEGARASPAAGVSLARQRLPLPRKSGANGTRVCFKQTTLLGRQARR